MWLDCNQMKRCMLRGQTVIADWPHDLGSRSFTVEQAEQARTTVQFDQLETEMAKLVSLQGGAIDWQKVEADAVAYLANEANDLAVAIWLTQAATVLYQAPGLQRGLEVLVRLHQQHWETMAPSVKRLRARRNQMQWLLEQLSRHLQQAEIGFTKEQSESAVASWHTLMQFWREHDEEAPALSGLLTLLVVSDEELVIDNSGLTESEEEEVTPEPLGLAIPEPVAPEPVVGTSSAIKNPESNALPVSKRELDQETFAVEKIETSTQLEHRIDRLFEQVLHEVGQPTTELLQDALFYRFNRSVAWLTLSALPYAQNGITRLSGPTHHSRERLDLLKNQPPLATLTYVESIVVEQRYWLDLQYMAYQAALDLQSSGEIAQAIAEATSSLVKRFPGIESLCFLDETPFASEETKNWLSQLTASESLAREPQADVVSQDTSGSIKSLSLSQSDVSVVALLASAQAQAKLAAQSLQLLEQQLTQNLNQFLNK